MEEARSKDEAVRIGTGPERELAEHIAKFLNDKKAEDVVTMDLRSVNPYFCFFVIASANSQVHLKSMAREVMKNFGHLLPAKSAPRPDDLSSGWIILDFIDVVVHLFLEEQRQYYNLERLWGDAPSVSLEEL